MDNNQLDRCTIPGCCRKGVPGNENVIDGRLVCDYCHADMRRSHNPRHLPMPRALAFDVFQHEFQHGRYAAHYDAKQAAHWLLQARVFDSERLFKRCPQAVAIDAVLAGGSHA